MGEDNTAVVRINRCNRCEHYRITRNTDNEEMKYAHSTNVQTEKYDKSCRYGKGVREIEVLIPQDQTNSNTPVPEWCPIGSHRITVLRQDQTELLRTMIQNISYNTNSKVEQMKLKMLWDTLDSEWNCKALDDIVKMIGNMKDYIDLVLPIQE